MKKLTLHPIINASELARRMEMRPTALRDIMASHQNRLSEYQVNRIKEEIEKVIVELKVEPFIIWK